MWLRDLEKVKIIIIDSTFQKTCELSFQDINLKKKKVSGLPTHLEKHGSEIYQTDIFLMIAQCTPEFGKRPPTFRR